MHDSVNSTDVISFLRNLVRASAMVILCKSVIFYSITLGTAKKPSRESGAFLRIFLI